MPRSGPGRYRRLMSGKSKKNKLEKQAFVENRRPSIAALDQSVTVEGSVPSDDMRAMIELSDKVKSFFLAEDYHQNSSILDAAFLHENVYAQKASSCF